MAYRIAIAGKGGTGKTTLAALLCRGLLARRIKPLLAVDADPNSCLAERMSVTVDRTIGQLREELRADPTAIPAGIGKSEWIERLICEEIAESAGFDLLVMGRQEGPECYCYINNLLRACLEKLATQYRAVIIDNEAGLEHLSRRTNGRVDVMLVVCEPTALGARTSQRIAHLIDGLKLDIGHTYLLLNRCRNGIPDAVRTEFDRTGFEILGAIPEDPLLTEFELERRSLLELPDDAPVAVAMDACLTQLQVLSADA